MLKVVNVSYIINMNTNSIDWINGKYSIAKSSKWFHDIVGSTRGLGYLTMHEYASMAHLNGCLERLLGYWESPLSRRACTFVAVRPHGDMPYVFVPCCEVHIRNRDAKRALGSTYVQRTEYVSQAAKPGTMLWPYERKWREFFRGLNAPAKYWGTGLGRRVAESVLDVLEDGRLDRTLPVVIRGATAVVPILGNKQHTDSRQAM
jgi:hypothetical protein